MRRSVMIGCSAAVVALVVAAQLVGPLAERHPAAALGDATRPYVLSSPIFTPKTGTSFTTLFTSIEDTSMSMLLRRYDAVGTLLTSQAITIGAHGSLQASPAAHSGAPLHVEIWAPKPGITMLITYTDSSDVSRRIEPGDMIKPRGAGTLFNALAPSLICDTRNNSNPTQCEGARLGSDATKTINVGGLGGVPSVGVSAVSLVAQIISPTQRSWLTFFRAGTSKPGVVHVFFQAGSGTVASGQVTVPVSSGGQLNVYNKIGTTDALIHVTGYYV